MKRLSAFLNGMRECGSDLTTHYGEPLIAWYDAGRGLALRLLGRER